MNDNRAMSNNDNTESNSLLHTENLGSTVVVEKHPNLTLLETGQNPGALLRSAREKAGLSLADVCAQTKINERLLIAIESGDVANMPPETFAKAFIKSYCKALNIDFLPVVLSFGFAEGANAAKVVSAAQVEATRIDSNEPHMPSSSRRLNALSFDRKPAKSLGYVIVLLALGLLAAFYIPVFLGGGAEQATGAAPPEVSSVSEAQPALVDPTTGEPLVNQAAETDSSVVSPQSSDPSAIFPALQEGEQQVAADASVALSAPSVPVDTSQQSLSSGAMPPVGTGKASTLKFSFDAPSWITVKDANDQVLISRVHDTGAPLEIKGFPPFKVIIGDAKSVKAFHNGKPVDLLSAARQNKVARLTIQ